MYVRNDNAETIAFASIYTRVGRVPQTIAPPALVTHLAFGHFFFFSVQTAVDTAVCYHLSVRADTRAHGRLSETRPDTNTTRIKHAGKRNYGIAIKHDEQFGVGRSRRRAAT